ncbi:uncharacterized protein LOC9636947 [Selaginella moellendorffii]|nr:uncharacterized protein LOC9636947 [Selaginella moellendorffii]|eukprot:XP_024533598.1 uncharacterized protein LOC9636947 [Selaginella moellendorffii]
MVSSCFENNAAGVSGSQASSCSQCQSKNLADNVLRMLDWRQISPSVRRPSKRLWRDTAASSSKCHGHSRETTNAKHALVNWLEAESFKHSIAKYCSLVPAPRSTIAAAFSPDGLTLASTHGDHTVKIICCQSGQCLKVLSGHRRTPWVVRFHPSSPEVLASGSLDYEVRLWNANTAECVASRDFYRPIASLAFHARGDLLAVASGHKLYIWQYTKEGDAACPNIVLRTRRSLRAVHFHPLAAPLVLTAEVNDLDSPDCPMSVATSREYQVYPYTELHYSHPGGAAPQNWIWTGDAQVQRESLTTTAPMDISPRPSNAAVPPPSDGMDPVETPGLVSETGRVSPTVVGGPWDPLVLPEAATGQVENISFGGASALRVPLVPVARRQEEAVEVGTGSGIWPIGLFPNIQAYSMTGQTHLPRFLHVTEPVVLDPFLQGWVRYDQPENEGEPQHQPQPPEPSGTRRGGRNAAEGRTQHRAQGVSRPQFTGFGVAEAAVTAATAAELPCTVKLKLWPHDIKQPSALLDPETCKLTIPHAVLCSEMGTHFSPCGRFLAACVACVLPPEAEPAQGRTNGPGGPGFSVQSPTQHPISTQQVIYELRIYSLEEATFGEVLASKAVRAAHCLTSIQFSPTSGHILLAYGRRHGSLLRSIVLDGTTTIPVYTILEIYRISDLKLVRVLPSAEDEVNVACFHPRVGGGLVYGTKEGKLRIIRRDWITNSFGSSRQHGLEDQLLEAETSDPLTFGMVPGDGD